MKCSECAGEYQIVRDALEIKDDYVGSFISDVIDYYKCSSCSDIILPSKSAKIIEANKKKILDDLLQSTPIKEFISSAEASEVLKISRQALHKHKRIRKGFIFSTSFSGKTVYLRKSVLLYKQKEDGRFPLALNINGIRIANIYYMPEQRNTLKGVYTDPNFVISINGNITGNFNYASSAEVIEDVKAFTYTLTDRTKELCITETGGNYGRS